MKSPVISTRNHIMRFRYLDPSGNEAHAKMVRALEDLYAPNVQADAARQFDETYVSIMRYGGRNMTLLRAREALDEDQFDQFMRLITHLSVVDGVVRPSGFPMELLIDRADFDDFETRETFRFSTPGDFVERQTFHDPVPVEEITELVGPSWSGRLFQTAWSINYMTTKLGNLEQMITTALSVGDRWNRTLEKFFVRDLIESNPTIKVDGVERTLFHASWASGSNDDNPGQVNALTRAALKSCLKKLGAMRIDDEPISNPAKYVLVAENSENEFVLDEILASTTKHDGENANLVGTLVPETLRQRKLTKLASPYLDPDSWFVLSDWSLQPALACEFGYWEGRDTPDVIDVDKAASEYFVLKGKNRWVARGGFGGTMRNSAGIVRGSAKS